MSTENEIPFGINPDDDIVATNKPKIKRIRLIIVSATLLVLSVGYISVLASSFSVEDKKEGKKEEIPEEKPNEKPKDNCINCIKAYYLCWYYETCKFYNDKTINHTLSISSMKVDGKPYPIISYYKFNTTKGRLPVIFEFNEKVKNMSYFFFSTSVTEVDFTNFDSSEMIDINHLFSNSKINTITWGPRFSTSKVVRMDSLFSSIGPLEVDLSQLNTSKTTNFSCMFEHATLESEIINLTSFDTSNAIDLSGMFRSSTFKSINVSSFNTSKVKLMNETFGDCMWLQTIDLSVFDTSKVTNMSNMFTDCSTLVSIEQHFTSESLTSAIKMFFGCRQLKKIDLSGFVGEVLTNIDSMFKFCYSSIIIDLRNFVCEKCNGAGNLFDSSGKGTLIYNSSKINPTIIIHFPSRWHRTDVSG